MKEIGGYFGLESLISNEYHEGLIPLNSGRNALLYILKAKKINKLYIPYYLCESISEICKVYGYDFEFYYVNNDFTPMFEGKLGEDEYLYIVNYYGLLTSETILNLKDRFGQIILDNVQAFFQRPIGGIDTIYSCRKYFGVPDGAYLFTDVLLSKDLEMDVSKDRMTSVLGRFEGKAADYYAQFLDNESSYKNEPLRYMSKLTHNILGAIDYEKVRLIRENNYAFLEEKLSEINSLKLSTPIGAFAYPLYFKNGAKIRRMLGEKKIYIPTLWPNVIRAVPANSIEKDYAVNILPLPCDQRYDINDMQYLINTIYDLMGKRF